MYEHYDNFLEEHVAQLIDFEMKEVKWEYDYDSKPNGTQKHWHVFCGHNIDECNLNGYEFGDTYYIGDFATQINVTSTVIHENFIYASSPDLGILRANINSNLIDFNNWQTIYFGDIQELFYDGENIFLILL